MLLWKEEEYGIGLLGDFELENLIEKTIKLTAKQIFKDVEKMRKDIWKREGEVGWKFCGVYDSTCRDIEKMLKKEWGV